MVDISGHYEWSNTSGSPFTQEVLRLDVDGAFPQMAASGTGTAGLQFNAHWVARPLTANSTSSGTEWSGPLFFKHGNSNLIPFSQVTMRLVGTTLRATFSGAGLADRVRDYEFKSRFFHEVTFEFDSEEGLNSSLEYQTHAHPDRPASLSNETLSIDTVFERAGFRVTRTGQDGDVPSDVAGSNQRWSNAEMHDAMQTHFSQLAGLPPNLANQARWALWTFFAGLHEDGTGLGGIMFDFTGTVQRQGTALFLNSFVSLPPASEPNKDAWRQRMAFWTAIHEMGHAFNLVHAWDKESSASWIPMSGGYELRSFMNYPYLYETGSESDANTIRFFRDFLFRFSDDELLFLRHAPEQFVIMGGDRWAKNHALEQARHSPAPDFNLELRVNRTNAEFEFLEPVVLEIKLTNKSGQPKLLPDRLLTLADRLTVLVERRNRGETAFHPYAHYCRQSKEIVLNPGESFYESLFLSVDGDGWLIDEPGHYVVQVCLHLPDEDVLSNRLAVRVTPPQSWDEEYLAQDYFSDAIGRVLTFDGSHVLTSANDTLQEVVAKLPGRNAAVHAQVALALPRLRDFKRLSPRDQTEGPGRYRLRESPADDASSAELAKVLSQSSEQADRAAGVLGHIDYHDYTDRCAVAMKRKGDADASRSLGQQLLKTFQSRQVLPRVLNEIAHQFHLEDSDEGPPRRRRRDSR